MRLVQRVTAVYSIKNESRAAWVVMRLCKGRRYTAMYDSVQHLVHTELGVRHLKCVEFVGIPKLNRLLSCKD